MTGTAVIYLPKFAPCSVAERSSHAGQCGCLNHEDYSQISHGGIRKILALALQREQDPELQANNLTKGDVFDKADYIFDHVDSLRIIKIIDQCRDPKTTT